MHYNSVWFAFRFSAFDAIYIFFGCWIFIDLKQCFRLNILEDIDDSKEQQNKIEELQQRIAVFWHWRANLMLVLNKFGKSLGGRNNMVLHHGANAKMLIKVRVTCAVR